MNRLESLSPKLAGELRGASEKKLSTAVAMACEIAVSKSNVEHPLVNIALSRLRAGQPLTGQDRAGLVELAEQLDDEYLKLQEASEEGEASTEDYLQAFAKARAVGALTFAGESSFESVSDSIYEAAAALNDDDKSDLLIQVEALLI